MTITVGTLLQPFVPIAGVTALLLSAPLFASEQAQLASIVSPYFDEEFLLKSAQYHRHRLNLFLIQTGLLFSVLLVLVRGPLGQWNRFALKLSYGRPWLARAAVLSIIYFGLALLRLPFSIARYYHAVDYDLRYDSLATYLLDWSKGFLIVWILVIVVGLIILGLFAAFPRWWTVLATTATGILAVGYTIFAPLFIDPLYYEFRPLENASLKQRLRSLGVCAGFEINEILVANASHRSSAVNAYVTGIGATKRIVLYDTLLEKFSPDEVAIVLAHETGHWAAAHIQKGLVLGIFGLLFGLLIADRIFNRIVRQHLSGVASREDPILAVPGYVLYVVMMYTVLVPSNVISRQMEAEADQKALELTRDPGTFIQTKVRIARSNLSNILPPAWVEFALFTHPSSARRILMAENFRDSLIHSDRPCIKKDNNMKNAPRKLTE